LPIDTSVTGQLWPQADRIARKNAGDLEPVGHRRAHVHPHAFRAAALVQREAHALDSRAGLDVELGAVG
jgi:hypothetical protein